MRCMLMCLVFVSVIGCGKNSEEKAAEKLVEKMLEAQLDQNVSVDISGDSVSMKGKDGTTVLATGRAATIPASFPKDVHVYKGSTVEVAMDMPTSKMITLLAKDSLSVVMATYKKNMSSQGWKEQSFMDMGEQAMLTFEKSERVVSVSISKDDESGGTRIMLMVMNQ